MKDHHPKLIKINAYQCEDCKEIQIEKESNFILTNGEIKHKEKTIIDKEPHSFCQNCFFKKFNQPNKEEYDL
jgi:hypothetical protein